MLVLSRKMQERIQIGPDITITVLRVRGGTVRVGIEAPRDVRVVRAELPRFEVTAEGHLTDASEGMVATNGVVQELVTRVVAEAVADVSPDDESNDADDVPHVGRRFVIRQKRCKFGRRAVATAMP